MKKNEQRINRLENRVPTDQIPWAMERVNGVLTAENGMTMSDAEFARRVAEGEVLPLVWADDV